MIAAVARGGIVRDPDVFPGNHRPAAEIRIFFDRWSCRSCCGRGQRVVQVSTASNARSLRSRRRRPPAAVVLQAPEGDLLLLGTDLTRPIGPGLKSRGD